MERELDALESNMIQNDQLGTSRICYVFFVDSNEQITTAKLEDAMTILVKRHALLRMCVRQVNGKFHWKEIEDLKMDIQVDSSTDWNLPFSQGVGTAFDTENGPLWRIRLMPNVNSEFFDGSYRFHAAIMFHFQHSIIDGMGKKYYYNNNFVCLDFFQYVLGKM